MNFNNLNTNELHRIDGGVDVGVIFAGVVTVIGGAVAIVIPEPASTAAGVVAVGGGITTIIAGIVD